MVDKKVRIWSELMSSLDKARALLLAVGSTDFRTGHAMTLIVETSTVHTLAGELHDAIRAEEAQEPVQLQLTREQAIELSLLLSTATCMYGNTKVDEAVQRDVKDVAAPVLAAIERATRKVSDGAGG